jgi:hypothetical protein
MVNGDEMDRELEQKLEGHDRHTQTVPRVSCTMRKFSKDSGMLVSVREMLARSHVALCYTPGRNKRHLMQAKAQMT